MRFSVNSFVFPVVCLQFFQRMKRPAVCAAEGERSLKAAKIEQSSAGTPLHSQSKATVQTLDKPTREQFAAFEQKNLPVKVTHAFSNWPAFSKWLHADGSLNVSGLLGAKAAADSRDASPVHVLVSPTSSFRGEVNATAQTTLPFADFLKQATASSSSSSDAASPFASAHCYLCQCPIAVQDDAGNRALLPHLAEDVRPLPAIVPAELLSSINLWMSVGATQSNLHLDEFHNLLVVLAGHKRVTLFAPEQTPRLYPQPVFSLSANHSRVDFKASTLEPRFARFADARANALEVTLEPGDALFMPEGW